MPKQEGNAATRRLFVAIHIRPDSNFLGQYRKVKGLLKNNTITWVNDDNIHLTLKFIGDTSADKIPAIVAELDKIISGFSAFTFVIRGCGIFGSQYKPKVIWFGTNDCRELHELAGKMATALEAIGIPNDRQNFVPHITLGRIKMVKDKGDLSSHVAALKDVFIQPVTTEEIILFESRLTPEGPVYDEIHQFSLGQAEEEKTGFLQRFLSFFKTNKS